VIIFEETGIINTEKLTMCDTRLVVAPSSYLPENKLLHSMFFFFFLKEKEKLNNTWQASWTEHYIWFQCQTKNLWLLARSRVTQSIFPMLFKRLVTGSNVTYHQHKPSLQFSSLFLSRQNQSEKIELFQTRDEMRSQDESSSTQRKNKPRDRTSFLT
jgi:hypothetical protein